MVIICQCMDYFVLFATTFRNQFYIYFLQNSKRSPYPSFFWDGFIWDLLLNHRVAMGVFFSAARVAISTHTYIMVEEAKKEICIVEKTYFSFMYRSTRRYNEVNNQWRVTFFLQTYFSLFWLSTSLVILVYGVRRRKKGLFLLAFVYACLTSEVWTVSSLI